MIRFILKSAAFVFVFCFAVGFCSPAFTETPQEDIYKGDLVKVETLINKRVFKADKPIRVLLRYENHGPRKTVISSETTLMSLNVRQLGEESQKERPAELSSLGTFKYSALANAYSGNMIALFDASAVTDLKCPANSSMVIARGKIPSGALKPGLYEIAVSYMLDISGAGPSSMEAMPTMIIRVEE
ncbi:MAG: hypothetical protein ABH825_00635 [Candidatus Omnitrophota bacterium]